MLSRELSLSDAALLIVDIQEDLLGAKGALSQVGLRPVGTEDRRDLLANCKRLLAEARQRGRPVVYVQTAFRHDLADCFFPPKWLDSLVSSPPVLVEGSPGVAIPEEIGPRSGDFHVTKKALSAFQFTHLDRLLQSLGVETCILTGFCGVAGSIDETARTTGLMGYDSVVVADAVYPLRSPHLETLTNRTVIKETQEIIELMKMAGLSRKEEQQLRPALILVAMNNDGNHPLGSKYRYGIKGHGPGLTEEERELYIFNNNRLIEGMTEKGFPVIHSQTGVRLDLTDDAHSVPAWRNRQPERDRKFPSGVGYMIEGTWGAEILEGVRLPEGYYRVPKKGNSSFGFTHLHRLLRNLRVNLCIIAGDSTTGCVSDTVREGVGLGYRCILVSDATSRANIPYHQVLGNRAEVKDTDAVLNLLRGLPARSQGQPVEPGLAAVGAK